MEPGWPSTEEWRAVQGGEPTLLLSPSEKLLEIIHAYPTNEARAPYEGPLAVVPTPIEQFNSTRWTSVLVGNKTVHLPNVLLWKYHGEPCEQRSGLAGSGYQRLFPFEVDAHIEQRIAADWQYVKPRTPTLA